MPGSDSLPDFVAARDHVVREVVRFARTLRAGGATVPATAALVASEALAAVGIDDRETVRAAMHATLLQDHRDGTVFEDNFPEFWYRLRTGLEATASADPWKDGTGDRHSLLTSATGSETAAGLAAPATDGDTAVRDGDGQTRRIAETLATDEPSAPDEERTRSTAYSAGGEGTTVEGETVGDRPLAPGTLRTFERALATLSGRRWTRAGHRQPDARRSLRASLGTGGVPVTLPTRGRAPTAFRCTVLVDVSRSVLDTVDEGFLLAVLDGLVADGRSTRVFFFDTDIDEVTAAFERADGAPAAALERAAVAWGGGTRIGRSLTTLRERWPDAVDRRSVTLVVSDGLDVGEVDRLERELGWLARRSRALLWLNPLAASTAYEPTCRGMAAALPYLDGLFAFADSADLAEVARQLDRFGASGPIGYEYDFRDRGVA